MQIRVTAGTRDTGHGSRPKARQAEAPGLGARHCRLAGDPHHPSYSTYWENKGGGQSGAGWREDCALTPSPKAAAPPQLPRKLAARCAKRKAGGKSRHLILERLSSSCLSTPPPPQISMAREQDGSCPQVIKILNGSLSCQALSPATKVDSASVKSPQVRGFQLLLCVSSEVSPPKRRGQWERFLRPSHSNKPSVKIPLHKS